VAHTESLIFEKNRKFHPLLQDQKSLYVEQL